MTERPVRDVHSPHELHVRCARCLAQVEHMECVFDPIDNAWRFIARCHGKMDHCEIPDSFFRVPGAVIVDAVAFGRRP